VIPASLRRVFERVPGIVFATDPAGTIGWWPRAAERALGYTAAQVTGRRCDEALPGFGRAFCLAGCPLRQERDEPLRPHLVELQLLDGSRRSFLCAITLFMTNRRSRPLRLYQLHEACASVLPVACGHADAPARLQAAGRTLDRLTRREAQILRELAEGRSNVEIARALDISPATVRNHTQNILSKLGVHSKLEAVVLALKPDAGLN
jgi:PAS domain S-box-containing protein